MGDQTLARARADSHRAGEILTASGAGVLGEFTAALVLADGTVLRGYGFGAATTTVGEVCFNTGMTGYQETLTDPSYAGQIITFTFPHIGIVGVNAEDTETRNPAVRGAVLRAPITEPSNWRALGPLDKWLAERGIPGLSGVDTRFLTRRIRSADAPTGVLTFDPKGRFDLDKMLAQARAWPGLTGMDLAREVSTKQSYEWRETRWSLKNGYGKLDRPKYRVVAVDYGAKHNILRCLASAGCDVTVVPASATAADILRTKPDGVFLSNGPGDPAATGTYAVPAIRAVLDSGIPLFGICLGHQLLGLALGGKTHKMRQGHRGANHPVKELATGKVEITSQNHGFTVDPDSLPNGVKVTHVSLFDQTVEGLAVDGAPVFSVQYHPEASPGPQDSNHLFHRFTELMERRR